MSSGRHRSREIALQVLFQREFNPKINSVDAFNQFMEHFENDGQIRDYAADLVYGVFAQLDEIDQSLNNQSPHWKVQRMALVDRNILRLGAFELTKTQDVPPEVAINEAIELAKRYGSQESPAFINGVLDKLYKSIKI